jgi:intracellular septation protein
MSAPQNPAPEAKPLAPLVKMAFELGPLVVFFVANARLGIFWATGLFMGAMAVSLIVMWVMARRLPIMPLISGAVVLVFGGLTLVLQDDTFIKLKPTIVNVLFGGVLLAGLAFGKVLLPVVFDGVLQLDQEGWRKLTLRWGVFFMVLAVLNEVVWRNFPTDTWVAFKVWGIMPLTMIFLGFQVPLLTKHALPEADELADGDKAKPD